MDHHHLAILAFTFFGLIGMWVVLYWAVMFYGDGPNND